MNTMEVREETGSNYDVTQNYDHFPEKYKSVDDEEEENGAISQREAIRALAGEDLPEMESEGVIS